MPTVSIYTVYSSLLIAVSLLSLLTLVLLLKYWANSTARALSLLVLTGLGVNVSMLLAMYSPNVESAAFWHGNIRLIFNAFAAPTGFFFIYSFIGGKNSKAIWFIFSVPALTVLVSLTNHWHHWLFSAYVMRLGEYYLRVGWTQGIWFSVISIHAFFITLGMLYLLFIQVKRDIKLPRRRRVLVIEVLSFTTVTILADTLGYYFAPGLINLPLGLGLANFTLVIGIWYLDLFDVLPIARETLTRYIPDGIIVIDNQNIVLDVNSAGAKIIGQHASRVVGKDVTAFFTEKARAEEARKILKGEYHDIQTIPIKGQEHFFDIVVTNIYIENKIAAAKLIVLRDVTELKRLQQQDIQRSALEERQRLARDLHDAVSQTLFSARVTSEMLLRQKKTIPPRALWANIRHLSLLVKSALGEMRILLLELRPESLTNSDLPTLLSHLIDAASSHVDADIELDAQGTYDPPVDVKIAFYRIAQEALNNIVKHAACTKVNIYFRAKPNGVELVIEDNGIGLEFSSAHGTKMGLDIMRERASEIRAGLKISSPKDQGTRVVCTWKAGE